MRKGCQVLSKCRLSSCQAISMRVCAQGSCGADAELCSPAGALQAQGHCCHAQGIGDHVPHAQHSLDHTQMLCLVWGSPSRKGQTGGREGKGGPQDGWGWKTSPGRKGHGSRAWSAWSRQGFGDPTHPALPVRLLSQGERWQEAKTQCSRWIQGKAIPHEDTQQQHSCPAKLCHLYPWKFSKCRQFKPWAAWSDPRADLLWAGACSGTSDGPSSPRYPIILWFCTCVQDKKAWEMDNIAFQYNTMLCVGSIFVLCSR